MNANNRLRLRQSDKIAQNESNVHAADVICCCRYRHGGLDNTVHIAGSGPAEDLSLDRHEETETPP